MNNYAREHAPEMLKVSMKARIRFAKQMGSDRISYTIYGKENNEIYTEELIRAVATSLKATLIYSSTEVGNETNREYVILI